MQITMLHDPLVARGRGLCDAFKVHQSMQEKHFVHGESDSSCPCIRLGKSFQ